MDSKYETLSMKLLHEAFMLIVLDYIALVLIRLLIIHIHACIRENALSHQNKKVIVKKIQILQNLLWYCICISFTVCKHRIFFNAW